MCSQLQKLVIRRNIIKIHTLTDDIEIGLYMRRRNAKSDKNPIDMTLGPNIRENYVTRTPPVDCTRS